VTDGSTAQKIPLIFFRTGAASKPVGEWLKGLAAAERQAIGMDLLYRRNGGGRLACRYAARW